MTTNNHTLLSSLYANPLAAGATAADLEAEADTALEFPTVESMPTIPPRACAAFASVVSFPMIPPRA